MIKTEFVEIKISKRNLKRYNSLGYICSIGENILIKVNDLPPQAKIEIEIICDYCGKEFPRMYYNHTNQLKRNKINKDCCKNCISKKNEESNMLVYGVKNVMQLQESKDALKNTFIEKYGVEHQMYLEGTKQKIKETVREQYGVDHVMQLDSVKEKMKQTNLNRYGKENFSQTDEYKIKTNETNLKKYGVNNVFQNKEIQNKQKKTVIEKYGVENVFQSDEIKEKSRKTMKNKYGVEHPMLVNEIKDRVIKKSKNTLYKNGTAQTSKQQIYLKNLFEGELNYQIDSFNLDIAFPDLKVYIEYDGGGHDLQVKMNRMSQEELKKEELKRYFFLKSKGWKEIRIISSRDYLPSDDVLLKEFENAINWFKSNKSGHFHYHIHINDKVNDDKYGKLRKV